MKFKWVYLTELVIGIILLAYMGIHYQTNQNPLHEMPVQEFNRGWTLECAGEDSTPEILPDTIDNPTGSPTRLTHLIPEDAPLDGESIVFYTIHMNVKAYVDDTLVYSLTAPENGPSKTPGNAWNVIDIKDQYRGGTLRVELTPAYQFVAEEVPAFMFGNKTDIIKSIFRNAAVSLFLCMIMLIIGLFIVLLLLFARKKMHLTKYVIWMGVFAIMLSIWSGGETQIFLLLFGNNLFFDYLTFISLKLIFIPIMVFVRYLYNTSGNKVMNILCTLSITDFIGTTFLQVFGIADYRETLMLTHLIYCLGELWIIYLTVRILVKGSGELRKRVIFHAMCLLFVALTVILDASFFYYSTEIDSARFSRLGMLVYILVLAYMVLRDSISMISVGRQASMIREDARKDGLTEVYNRKAYEEAVGNVEENVMKKCSIAMFDLNNLKNVNDLYGHKMGDHYIVTVSRILMDVFGTYGTVYRIGGDEFCAIVKNMSEELFVKLNEQVEAQMQLANERYLERRMSVASGFAVFDEKSDKNLRDVMARADQAMYQNKQRMKNLNKRSYIPKEDFLQNELREVFFCMHAVRMFC